MTALNINTTSCLSSSNKTCSAKQLNQQQRQYFAEQALSGDKPISHLAEEANTSRKFIYKQKKRRRMESIKHLQKIILMMRFLYSCDKSMD